MVEFEAQVISVEFFFRDPLDVDEHVGDRLVVLPAAVRVVFVVVRVKNLTLGLRFEDFLVFVEYPLLLHLLVHVRVHAPFPILALVHVHDVQFFVNGGALEIRNHN